MVLKKEFYLKKNYLYITKDNKVKYKNLGVRKKSISAISKKIFNVFLIPKIIAEKKVKFSRVFFKNLILKLLSEDLSLAEIRYKVNDKKTYKMASSIQYQIAEKYGAGIHFLIPNKKFGVGKDKKYCSMDEFREQNLKLEDIDLSNVWAELEYFIEKEQKIDLKGFFNAV
jgi:hypothetical protein